MMRVSFTLILFVIAALAIIIPAAGSALKLAASTHPAGTTNQFAISGISTVNLIDVDRVGHPFDTSNPTLNAYVNPNTAGVTFRTSWADVEPTEGHFDFHKLDDVFAGAEKHGKWVELILIPGFGTPKWAMQDVQTLEFAIVYGPGSKSGQLLPLPVPWDQTYLSRWFTFLKVIGQRYENRPSFKMIAAAGPTSVSSEMSLPNTADDLVKWRQVNYTSKKYIDAWKQTFEAYSTTFPHQFFSLALYPGLPIPNKKQRTSTREAVIRIGLQYPHQFALEEDGLNASKANSDATFGYTAVMEHVGQIATGFMMSTSAVLRPQNMGTSNDPAVALKQAIDRGMTPNSAGQRVDYLGIYEPDITAEGTQSVLRYGASLFGKKTQ